MLQAMEADATRDEAIMPRVPLVDAVLKLSPSTPSHAPLPRDAIAVLRLLSSAISPPLRPIVFTASRRPSTGCAGTLTTICL